MIDSSFPILSACLAWPVLGAVLVMVVKDRAAAKWLALAVSLLELVMTLGLVAGFDAGHGGFQFVEDLAWIPGLNVRYQLGVDGLSVLFLPLTAWLTVVAIAAAWHNVMRLPRFHFALLLLLESITLGVFTALDLVLFFLFWELTLPPLFFLIGLWGVGAERRAAAMKYVLYMLFGGVPLLFGIVLLAIAHGDMAHGLSFSLPQLLEQPLPAELQMPIFLLLLLGFAVKMPLLPLHSWLPTTAMEAPPQISALLLGLKLGVYGLIRIAIPLAPTAAQEQRWLLAILGAVTLIYGALLALRQSNLRRLLAYAGVSHVGLVVVAVASFKLQGLQGALMQLLNFGIVASTLMLMAGMLQQRLGSNELLQLGGLAKPLPRLTTLFFVFALSSIGVPGLNGFPAELLMILGTLQAFPALAAIALLAAVLGAAYMLDAMRRSFFGPQQESSLRPLQDLNRREWLMLAPAVLLAMLLGFLPQAVLDLQQAGAAHWVNGLKPAISQGLRKNQHQTLGLDGVSSSMSVEGVT